MDHQVGNDSHRPVRDPENLRIDVEELEEGKNVPFVLVNSTRHLSSVSTKEITPTLPPVGDKVVIPEARFTPRLIISWIISVMGSFQFAYGIGVTGAVKSKIIFPGHTTFQWSLCVSIFSIGGLFGSIFAGRICATWARKRVMFLGGLVFILAGLIMGFAVNMVMLTAGRFVVGFGGGMSTVVVPLYLKEFAPPNLRGRLGTGHQIGSVVGVWIADLLAFGFGGESKSLWNPGWRFMLGFSAVVGLLQIIMLPLVSESPYWLVGEKRIDEAANVLAKLRGNDDNSAELDVIRTAMEAKEEDEATLWSVIKDRSVRRQLVTGVLLHMFMRFSGFNAVTFYTNSIFEKAGFSKPLIGTTLVGTINMLATFVALVLIDRQGRRPLLIKSAIGMFGSAVVLTLAFNNLLPLTSVVSVLGVMGFVAFFEIGLGPVPWMLVPEILPARSRPKGVALAINTNWLCLFTIGIIFPTMQANLGHFTFLPFAISHIISLIFIIKVLPETKGKSVKEIAAAMQEMKRK